MCRSEFSLLLQEDEHVVSSILILISVLTAFYVHLH